MGIAFHPTTGLQGVFRVGSGEAETFTVGRIDAAMGSTVVTDQRHVYPTSDMLFCGSRDEAATLAIHLNDLAKSFCRFTAGARAEAAAEIRVMEDRIQAMRESLASALGSARDAHVADIAAFIQAAACGELEPLETDS